MASEALERGQGKQMDCKTVERSSKSSSELSTSFSCQMEGLYVAMLGGKIELGWLVPNKMLYLISLWETFDVRATAICEIYLRRSVLLQQKKKKVGAERSSYPL